MNKGGANDEDEDQTHAIFRRVPINPTFTIKQGRMSRMIEKFGHFNQFAWMFARAVWHQITYYPILVALLVILIDHVKYGAWATWVITVVSGCVSEIRSSFNEMNILRKARSTRVITIDLEHGKEMLRPWHELREGMLIKLLDGDESPADIAVLSCGAEFALADSSFLQGRTTRMKKVPLKDTQAEISASLLSRMTGQLMLPPPYETPVYRMFQGCLKLTRNPRPTRISLSNVILAGSHVSGAPWLWGAIMFMEDDTAYFANSVFHSRTKLKQAFSAVTTVAPIITTFAVIYCLINYPTDMGVVGVYFLCLTTMPIHWILCLMLAHIGLNSRTMADMEQFALSNQPSWYRVLAEYQPVVDEVSNGTTADQKNASQKEGTGETEDAYQKEGTGETDDVEMTRRTTRVSFSQHSLQTVKTLNTEVEVTSRRSTFGSYLWWELGLNSRERLNWTSWLGWFRKRARMLKAIRHIEGDDYSVLQAVRKAYLIHCLPLVDVCFVEKTNTLDLGHSVVVGCCVGIVEYGVSADADSGERQRVMRSLSQFEHVKAQNFAAFSAQPSHETAPVESESYSSGVLFPTRSRFVKSQLDFDSLSPVSFPSLNSGSDSSYVFTGETSSETMPPVLPRPPPPMTPASSSPFISESVDTFLDQMELEDELLDSDDSVTEDDESSEIYTLRSSSPFSYTVDSQAVPASPISPLSPKTRRAVQLMKMCSLNSLFPEDSPIASPKVVRAKRRQQLISYLQASQESRQPETDGGDQWPRRKGLQWDDTVEEKRAGKARQNYAGYQFRSMAVERKRVDLDVPQRAQFCHGQDLHFQWDVLHPSVKHACHLRDPGLLYDLAHDTHNGRKIELFLLSLALCGESQAYFESRDGIQFSGEQLTAVHRFSARSELSSKSQSVATTPDSAAVTVQLLDTAQAQYQSSLYDDASDATVRKEFPLYRTERIHWDRRHLKKIKYTSSSTFEENFVKTAAAFGYSLLYRTRHEATLDIWGTPTRIGIVGYIPTLGTRRKQSVVINTRHRDAPHVSVLLCMSPAETMYESLDISYADRTRLQLLVRAYTQKGLHCHIFAYRYLSPEETQCFKYDYQETLKGVRRVTLKLVALGEAMENDMTFLGVITSDPQIAGDAGSCLRHFHDVGMGIHLVTGDLPERLVLMALKLEVVSPDFQFFWPEVQVKNASVLETINERFFSSYSPICSLAGVFWSHCTQESWISFDKVREACFDFLDLKQNSVPDTLISFFVHQTLLKFLQARQECFNRDVPLCAVISGRTLSFLAHSRPGADVLCLILGWADVVLLPRVSPLQKAALIQALKTTTQGSTYNILFVGGGGCDTLAFDKADVSARVTPPVSQKGRAMEFPASRKAKGRLRSIPDLRADFSLPSFKALERLIFSHGTSASRNICLLTRYIVYTFTGSITWYVVAACADSRMNAATLYLILQWFVPMTLPAVVTMGIFQKDYHFDAISNASAIVKICRKHCQHNVRIKVLFFLEGLAAGFYAYLISQLPMNLPGHRLDSRIPYGRSMLETDYRPLSLLLGLHLFHMLFEDVAHSMFWWFSAMLLGAGVFMLDLFFNNMQSVTFGVGAQCVRLFHLFAFCLGDRAFFKVVRNTVCFDVSPSFRRVYRNIFNSTLPNLGHPDSPTYMPRLIQSRERAMDIFEETISHWWRLQKNEYGIPRQVVLSKSLLSWEPLLGRTRDVDFVMPEAYRRCLQNICAPKPGDPALAQTGDPRESIMLSMSSSVFRSTQATSTVGKVRDVSPAYHFCRTPLSYYDDSFLAKLTVPDATCTDTISSIILDKFGAVDLKRVTKALEFNDRQLETEYQEHQSLRQEDDVENFLTEFFYSVLVCFALVSCLQLYRAQSGRMWGLRLGASLVVAFMGVIHRSLRSQPNYRPHRYITVVIICLLCSIAFNVGDALLYCVMVHYLLHPTIIPASTATVAVTIVGLIMIAFESSMLSALWAAQVVPLCMLGIIAVYQRERRHRREFLVDLQTEMDRKKNREILNSLLPAFVVEAMLEGDVNDDGIPKSLSADEHNNVCVIFCDIYEFQLLVKYLDPKVKSKFPNQQVLLELLDTLFLSFDFVAEECGVTKIETVSETYLSCTGLEGYDHPNVSSLKALDLALAMLELCAFTNYEVDTDDEQTANQCVRVKIGIHAGRVMSGLVGFKKPQFALFGDTVNTASRMKLTGIVDHVHVSDDYRKVLQMENGMLNWLTREIQVKGKGSMTTHLLKSVQGMDYPQFNQGVSDSNRTAKTVQDVLQSIRRDTVVLDREKEQKFAPDHAHSSSPADNRRLSGRASFHAEFERQRTITPDTSSESAHLQTRLRNSLTDRRPPPPRAAMEIDSQPSTQMSRTSKLHKLWKSVQSKTKRPRKREGRIDVSEERPPHRWAPDPVHRSSLSSSSSFTEESNKYDLEFVINRMSRPKRCSSIRMPWLEFEDPADEARYQEDFNDTIGTGSATSFMIAAIFFCLDAALFFMQEDHKILLPLDQRTQLVNSGELSMIYFTCIALAVAGFMLNSSTSGIGITGVFIPNKTILPLFSVMCSFAIWICSLMPMWTLRFAIVEQAILPRNSITIIFFILFNATTEVFPAYVSLLINLAAAPFMTFGVIYTYLFDIGAWKSLNSIILGVPLATLGTWKREYGDRVVWYTQFVTSKQSRAADMLLEMMPREVSVDFQNDDLQLCYEHERMTLVFSDIVGFTTFSKGSEPTRVLTMLQKLFAAFDKSTISKGLYKLCTIGDAYVATTEPFTTRWGATFDSWAGCQRCIEFAEMMVTHIVKVREDLGIDELDMRIGLHYGNCIGAIVGSRRLRYDMYGIDIMTGTLMESSGVAGNINVSNALKSFIERHTREDFDFKFNKVVKVLDHSTDSFLIRRKTDAEKAHTRIMSN